jgi:hypothetical protein
MSYEQDDFKTMPEDSRAGDGRAVHSWTGKIFRRFFMEGWGMREHTKVFEGGKPVFKLLNGHGEPVRDVETVDWEMGMYINYCLFPLSDCIKRMHREGGENGEGIVAEYANILDRLYDTALAQLGRMEDAIYEGVGQIEIITTNEDCRGGFLHQDFLEVYTKKESNGTVTT